MHLKAAHVLLHGLAAREHGPLRATHAPVASKRDKCIAKWAQLAPKELTGTQELLRSVECELEHVRTFTKWQDTPRQLVPWGRWEGLARMLLEIQGQFHVRDLALAREPQQGPCPPQQGMQKRRLPRPMRRQPLRCIQRGSGRRLLEERGGGGVWDPKVCVPEMARQDFPNGKFRFFPRWPLWSWGGGGVSSCGCQPFLYILSGRGGGGNIPESK